MNAIQGMSGYWHATNDAWLTNNKVSTLCRGKGVAPNHRSDGTAEVDCPKCLKKLSE